MTDQPLAEPFGDAGNTTATSTDGGMPIGAILRLVVAATIVGAVVIFVLQNLDSVPVSFLSWSFDAPLILLLAIAAVAGILLRWILSFVRARRKRAA